MASYCVTLLYFSLVNVISHHITDEQPQGRLSGHARTMRLTRVYLSLAEEDRVRGCSAPRTLSPTVRISPSARLLPQFDPTLSRCMRGCSRQVNGDVVTPKAINKYHDIFSLQLLPPNGF